MRNDPKPHPVWRARRFLVFVVASTVLVALVATVFVLTHRSRRAEISRLTELLSLREGMTVAEIGAGTGWLSVEVARRVGRSGRVYSTELSADRVDDIRHAIADVGLNNVTVLQAGERATHLPAECCDAIFMRRVYHHLTAPSAILTSIHEALKAGGRLVIIDFRPDGIVGIATGMGADRAEVIRAAAMIGFGVVTADEWPGWDHYVVMFAKSHPARVATH